MAFLTADATNISEVSYTITDNTMTFASPKLVSDVLGCVLSYSFDVADPTVEAALTLTNDPTSPEFSLFYAADLSVVGTHEVSVTAMTGTLGLSQEIVTFNLNLLNPCIDPNFVSVVPSAPA